MAGRQLCQWDKDSCSDAGFLKIDLLGLGMLSAVERCVESIAEARDEHIDLSRIPLDDLTVQVALVRPGPIIGGAVHPYIERRKALRADPDYRVPYEHPALEPVLSDTLGAIVFQDQVIQVAMAFANFTAGEAEGLRRAMRGPRVSGTAHSARAR